MKVVQEGHGAPSEVVLDLDVFCTAPIEEHTSCSYSQRVAHETEIRIFGTVTLVSA
jgi:hypothetical protein